MGQSNKPQTIGYRYFMGIHMSLCRGPINELREIRVGDRVAWSGSALGQARWLIASSALFGGDEGEGGIYGTIDMMLGTETQPVNPRLKRMLGSALVPAFRGMTTLFFDGLISSMNPYPKPWAFRARRVTAGWDDDNVWYPEKALIWQGNDTITSMNPAHIIYEAFTNREWGRGRSAARMHDASFRAAADKLYAEGFGLCICWRRQEGLGALVKSVIDHIGGVLLDDLVTAQVSLYLIRDDYVVDDLPLFDEDSGLLGIDEDDAADGAMATNEVVVKFTNMMNQGADDQVRVQNNAAIQSVGAVLSETVQYPHVPTSGLAARLAQRDLASKSAAVRRFKVRLDRRGAAVLPGKAFRIRSLKRGYEQLVLRAGPCDYGTLEAGTVTISAVIDAYGLPDTAYVAPQPPTVNPPTADPLPATVRRIFEVPYRDLVHFLSPAQMAEVTDTSCAVGVIARRPSAAARAYTLLTRVGAAAWGGVDTGDWCPTAQIATALDYLTTTTRITYGTDISTVQPGAPALIDDEIVRVVSLDIDTGDLVIARGCADTVPAKHAAGARIWFYESDTAVDPVDYAPGVTVQAKVQTRTSTGLLDLELAPVDGHLTARRQARPYPPGNFRLVGSVNPASVVGDVVASWAHRDRLLQADQLVDTLTGNIGPEAGTTYTFRLLRADTQAVLASQTSISGTTATLTTTYVGQVIAELWSVRAGLASVQRHRWHFSYLPVAMAIIGDVPQLSESVPFSTALTVTAGQAPILWALGSGTLPPGVELSVGGVLQGTPQVMGNYSITVVATDAQGFTASRAYSIVVGDAPVVPSEYTDVVVSLSPFGYWRLGEASGTVALDSSGNSRNGMYAGSRLARPSLIPSDPDDGAMGCNGSGYVNVALASPLAVSGKTVLMSIKMDSFAAFSYLCHFGSYGQSGARGLAVYINTNGTLSLEWVEGSFRYIHFTEFAAVLGVAYRLTLRFESSQSVSLFVNGVLVATKTTTLNMAAEPGTSIRIGAGSGSAAAAVAVLRGDIDEFAVIPSALSDAEILYIEDAAV